MKNKAFTLVELIVVVTILWILWSIAFISLENIKEVEEWKIKEPEVKQEYICTDISEKILKTNILWKSWADESQWAWAIVWFEIWLAGWAIVWWPIWAWIWAVWWMIWGAVLWTFDRAIDYETYTEKWKYVCQEKNCENILWESFKTDWEKILKEECERK